MAIQVDTSKPLTDEQIEELRKRLPESLVQHYIARAEEGAAAAPAAPAPAPAAKPAAKGTAKKDDGGDIL